MTSYEYDSRGRLQRISRGTGSTPLERIEYTYDPTTGKKSSETANAFENNAWAVKKSETYTYTSDGNLSSVVHADNTRQLFAYLCIVPDDDGSPSWPANPKVPIARETVREPPTSRDSVLCGFFASKHIDP